MSGIALRLRRHIVSLSLQPPQNWDKLRTVVLDTLDGPLDSARVAPLISGLPLELKPALERFILAAFAVFDDLDCTLLEMNPWCA
jgi:ATP citrate (pro-S)-lyase